MGQIEILEVLKKENKPLSASEIAGILDCDTAYVNKKIRIMIKYHEICYKEVDKEIAKQKYRCNRRMRIYFL
jgi:predicted transcriptional regulator